MNRSETCKVDKNGFFIITIGEKPFSALSKLNSFNLFNDKLFKLDDKQKIKRVSTKLIYCVKTRSYLFKVK